MQSSPNLNPKQLPSGFLPQRSIQGTTAELKGAGKNQLFFPHFRTGCIFVSRPVWTAAWSTPGLFPRGSKSVPNYQGVFHCWVEHTGCFPYVTWRRKKSKNPAVPWNSAESKEWGVTFSVMFHMAVHDATIRLSGWSSCNFPRICCDSITS